MSLKPCPCGKTPTRLIIEPGGSCKYAWCSGDCCNEWAIEFRTDYGAEEAWNAKPRAPRAEELQDAISRAHAFLLKAELDKELMGMAASNVEDILKATGRMLR